VSSRAAVVHLVRHANGPEPLDAFLSSYERHDAGCDHDLVLLCKGFPDRDALAPVRRRARDHAPHEVVIPDTGLDLTAYFAAARELPHDRLCFVNSYSEVLAPRWLDMLCGALDQARVGAAAASGSWASRRSFAFSLLRLPNGYRGTLGDRRRMTPALRSVSTAPKVTLARRLVRAALALPGEITAYPGFPAPHLRTNAFAIGRELMLSLRVGAIDTKPATYRLEAGRGSLTAQLRERGLQSLVVDRDGVARAPAEWPDVDVFWQGEQSRLLVADNQTRQYEAGAPAVREALARYAWGPRARPSGGTVG
jgi:hypothetical protein